MLNIYNLFLARYQKLKCTLLRYNIPRDIPSYLNYTLDYCLIGLAVVISYAILMRLMIVEDMSENIIDELPEKICFPPMKDILPEPVQ